jgi:hypothetical protein
VKCVNKILVSENLCTVRKSNFLCTIYLKGFTKKLSYKIISFKVENDKLEHLNIMKVSCHRLKIN